MLSNLLESILEATTGKVSRMAIEYGQLISLPKLTDTQGERLQEILDCACDDGALSFWISELDHILGHETGLLNPDSRKEYDNKKALLQEYFTAFQDTNATSNNPSEIRASLERYLADRKNPKSVDPLSAQERPHASAYGYQSQESNCSD